jgi:chemotaxis protein CheD
MSGTQPLPLQAAPASAVHVLHPGDVVCAERGARLETLLGSCVAIILTDPRRTVGAMCHIVHPSAAPTGHALAATLRPGPGGRPAMATGPRSKSGAFADVALRTMYAQLHARGIVPHLCEAYVYGGANMFPHLTTASPVGDRNASWALAALAADGVRVLAHDVGGQRHRRLSWVVGPHAPQLVVAGA